MTLDGALTLARRHHPALRGAAWRVRATHARRLDAGRLPNPTIELGVENVGGSLGSGRRETTALVEQMFEMGGKREARAATADALTAVADAEVSSEERLVLANTAERFLEAWVLQERAERLVRAERLAEQTIAAARQRYRAGAGPAVEAVRAEAVLALREAERFRATTELTGALERLASQWGATSVGFDSLALGAPDVVLIPGPEQLRALIDEHPDRRRAAAEVIVEEARVREARTARIPDVAVRGGVKHLAEADGTGFVAGVSVPLPLWSRQRGGVLAAEAERSAAISMEQMVANRLSAELRAAYERYRAASGTFEALQTRVRPKTEEALRELAAGYRVGRFSSLDLLDAQRSVLETELSLVEAAADAWQARHTLERLVGASLDRLRGPEERR